MSESISCSYSVFSLLYKIRGSETWPRELVHSIGEECPGAFFRIVVESLADSFEPAQAEAYTQLMGAWSLAPASSALVIPDRVDAIFVLSRVTLGADIKVTSVILDCMKRRFPEARVVLVANRKSAELFAADPRIEHLVRDYPRRGPVSEKLEFARSLTRALVAPNRIVIDPDSRLTQLGLAAVCERERYFHFPSRTVATTLPETFPISRGSGSKRLSAPQDMRMLRSSKLRWKVRDRVRRKVWASEKTKPSGSKAISKHD